ncbi:hypothetical protein [Flavobacterium frigoris]|jgi:hypothetical protein|uniref:Uncharacterized protein n=1 Tax=Flavobacterium frigoris (strain PS1) TaxID=1086011 RepID=H7FVP7_FLAFP|nr:hypothetical protein [Flavobacterium frigoris]EIA07469.1 hypothetical protein HJ01_03272 [Flavobacterium frigoris PS1]|tara:strand:- start:12595 stop:13926 length:1332 start_codon:yes stop_codon:yes gene_type:complete
METQSVLRIKTSRDQIKESLNSFDTSQFNSTKFGNENEYNGKGIYLGLNALLIDVSYFIKSHNIFIQVSTLEERNEIAQDLDYILSYIQKPQLLYPHIDSLKVKLRKYNVRNSIERWELFQDTNKLLLEQGNEFKEALKFIHEIKEEATNSNSSVSEKLEAITKKFEELEEKIEEVEEVKTEIVLNSDKLESINENLVKVNGSAETYLEEIKESLSEVKNNEKLISAFAQKIQERDNRLGELQQLTEENKQKLNEYNVERLKILEEADNLIESAKTALNYKTAEGISASFQIQHTDAKKWQYSRTWIIGASLFILVAIGLGVWITLDTTNKLHLIIGRIALIPLPIIAAIFCANQYVKQKNLIEDYAYKMVLAKSIVGFSEQLKKDASVDKGEYIHYMKVALEEIHKDPLRKRDQKSVENKIENFSIKEILEVAERMVKIGKS